MVAGAGKIRRVRSPRSKTQCERSIIVQKRVKNHIPIRRWNIKNLCGRDHEVRESTLRQYHPVGSVDLREEFQGNSDGSQPTEAHEHAEARNDFCGCRKSHDGSLHFPFDKMSTRFSSIPKDSLLVEGEIHVRLPSAQSVSALFQVEEDDCAR